MKKQLLLLFAASALFAACSSDDMPAGNNTNNGQEPTTEVDEYATSYGVTTEEGVGMVVGVLDQADTRATGESNVYFDLVIDLKHVLGQQDYFLEADDFAIRKNGDYIATTDLGPLGKSEIKVTATKGDKLKVRVENLQDLEYSADEVRDYTFEVYMWIENKTLLDDGTGSYGELFTEAIKKQWIGLEADDKVYEGMETGVDMTKWIAENWEYYDGVGLLDGGNNDEKVTQGYSIRYNVYRGLSGHGTDGQGNFELGDTPYIKVSIHVNRLPDEADVDIIPIYLPYNPTPAE